MAIYDNLPYTNFHELNADWLLKQMKEAKAKVDSIQEDIDQFNATYAALAAVFNVSGNNVSIPGTMTANGFMGNLTGNVTGNVTGNADTATYATSAGSATTATNAINANHATTADSATTAGSATTATNATNADHATTADSATSVNGTGLNIIDSTDANDYIPDNNGLYVFQANALNSNVPGSQNGERAVLLTMKYGNDHVLQIAWFYVNSQDLYYRQKYYSSWQGWYKITASQAV